MLLTCIKLKLHFINTVPILSQTYNWNPLRKEVQSANRCKNNNGGNMDRDMMGIMGESYCLLRPSFCAKSMEGIRDCVKG